MPGTMRTLSSPRMRKTGQRQSAKFMARSSVPSDVLGATRFAAKARPTCPRNMGSRLGNQVVEFKPVRLLDLGRLECLTLWNLSREGAGCEDCRHYRRHRA